MLLRLAVLLSILLEVTYAMQCDCVGKDREDKRGAETLL
jgi:hypothetical protein